MIYAVSQLTKDHREYIRCDPIGKHERLVHGDCDGWIPWHGGQRPLPDWADYEAKRRDGEITMKVDAWAHAGAEFDIIAYRPILEAKNWIVDNMVSIIAEHHSGNKSEAKAICQALYEAGYRRND